MTEIVHVTGDKDSPNRIPTLQRLQFDEKSNNYDSGDSTSFWTNIWRLEQLVLTTESLPSWK